MVCLDLWRNDACEGKQSHWRQTINSPGVWVLSNSPFFYLSSISLSLSPSLQYKCCFISAVGRSFSSLILHVLSSSLTLFLFCSSRIRYPLCSSAVLPARLSSVPSLLCASKPIRSYTHSCNQWSLLSEKWRLPSFHSWKGEFCQNIKQS